MNTRIATIDDFDGIWPIFKEIVSAGETYPYPRDTSRTRAERLWMELRTYVVEENGVILGTYYIRDNQPGRGSHVCNCGYMVSHKARRRGIGTLMCRHSQDEARKLGYRAMQFNLVVSTNTAAVGLWKKLGFEITGSLPGAFDHPELGYVDAFVMYKKL